MNLSDPQELKGVIERAQKGDSDAFSLLYKTYFSPLYRYIYFRVGEKAEAEDLTQDVFVRAYGSFARYSNSGSYSGISPLAYFYTIARNAVIDHRRKKRILVADDEDALMSVADVADSPQEQASKKEEGMMIRKEIARLPEDQQDVIVLRFIDELSTKEISGLLGKTEDAIRQLQSRGLKSLRKNILHE